MVTDKKEENNAEVQPGTALLHKTVFPLPSNAIVHDATYDYNTYHGQKKTRTKMQSSTLYIVLNVPCMGLKLYIVLNVHTWD